MARALHGIEKGIRLFQENGDELVDILTGTAAPDGLLDQSAAPIGSLYVRSGTGELYQKITNVGNSSDWQLNGATSAVIGTWRPESVVVVPAAPSGLATGLSATARLPPAPGTCRQASRSVRVHSWPRSSARP